MTAPTATPAATPTGTPTGTPALAGSGRFAASANVMLVLLAASFAMACLDRMLMVVVGETVKAEFQLSDKELSLLTGAAFVFIYGISGVVAGWLIDRVNRRKLLAWALALWSVLTMACGMAGSFAQLALARAGVGVGEAPNAPAAFSLIADLYPPKQRPAATAVFMIGGMVGMLASFAIGAWVAAEYGWRAAFMMAGPPGLILAAAIYLMGREPAREPAASTKQEGSLRLVFGHAPLVWLLMAQAFASFAAVGLMQWLPMFFIRTHGLSLVQIGIFFGPAMAIGTIVGMALGGVAGNRVAARSVPAMMAFCAVIVVLMAPVFAGLLLAPSLQLALALTFVGAALSGVYIPVSLAGWQTVCDPRARGLAGGVSSLLAQFVGGAVCPFAVGALSDALAPSMGADSLRYALLASLVFLVVGAGLYLVAMRLTGRRAVV